jgi:competence protein ComEC
MVLPWLAAAWFLGIAAAPGLPLKSWQWFTLALVAAVAAYVSRRERWPRLAFACLVCLSLGGVRSSVELSRRESASIAGAAGMNAPVGLVGVVATAPSTRRDGVVFDVRSRGLEPEGPGPEKDVDGVVRVLASSAVSVRRGETVRVSGRLRAPSGTERLEVSAFLKTDTVQRLAAPPPGWTTWLDDSRAFIVRRLHSVLPDGEASLIAGVLLGVDETMPAPLLDAFRITGTAHILAVSGFNVTIVAAAALAVFGSLIGPRRGGLAAGAAILIYTLLVGADPPVVRAAIMAGIVLLAARWGRQPDALAALGAAAIGMTLLQPADAHDIGFQLSFLATLGLVLAARPLTDRFGNWVTASVPSDRARPILTLLGETVLVTLVAQLATLPISVYTFGQLPLTALPANALILPAQPPLMATGALAAVASLIDVRLGAVAAWSAWPFAAYTLRVAQFFAAIPGASLELPPLPWIAPLLMYAVLVLSIWAARAPQAPRWVAVVKRLGWAPALLLLGLLTIGAWKFAAEQPDGRLTLTALPGGALLIETPQGRFAALSSASGQIGLRSALDRLLPLTHTRLDWLILTQSGATAADAIESLQRFPPADILAVAGSDPQGSSASGGSRVHTGGPGHSLDLGDGARFDVLRMSSADFVGRVTLGRARIVILDAGSVGRREALENFPGATAVILIGDGRRMPRALKTDWPAPAPLVVIACPSAGDPMAPPGDSRLLPGLLTTEIHGWIRLTTEGTRLEIRTEHAP